MGKILVLLVAFAGCVTDMGDSSDIVPVAFDGAENGFGYPCVSDYPPIPPTVCYGDNHAEGMCALNVCRQRCINDRTCPKHYSPIPTVNYECWCQPIAEPWDPESMPDWRKGG